MEPPGPTHPLLTQPPPSQLAKCVALSALFSELELKFKTGAFLDFYTEYVCISFLLPFPHTRTKHTLQIGVGAPPSVTVVTCVLESHAGICSSSGWFGGVRSAWLLHKIACTAVRCHHHGCNRYENAWKSISNTVRPATRTFNFTCHNWCTRYLTWVCHYLTRNVRRPY